MVASKCRVKSSKVGQKSIEKMEFINIVERVVQLASEPYNLSGLVRPRPSTYDLWHSNWKLQNGSIDRPFKYFRESRSIDLSISLLFPCIHRSSTVVLVLQNILNSILIF